MLSSSPLKERDTGCSSLSPIKPSIELERSVVSVTKRCLEKEIFKLSSSPPLEGARLSVYCKTAVRVVFPFATRADPWGKKLLENQRRSSIARKNRE